MNTLVNTTLCYIQKDDCYLMLHRVKKKKDYNKDKWIGIGGKFENGESPFDCIKREVLEETGLVLNEEKLEYRGIVTFVCKNSEAPDIPMTINKRKTDEFFKLVCIIRGYILEIMRRMAQYTMPIR